MYVGVASTVGLYVTDPPGRHVGTGPDGQTVNETAGAACSRPEAKPEWVVIDYLLPGGYSVELIEVGDGSHALTSQLTGIYDEPLVETASGTVEAGKVVSKLITVPEEPKEEEYRALIPLVQRELGVDVL